MATIPAPPTPERISAGFAFARQLHDPTFRARLRAAGHNGQVTVVALPDDRIADVMARLDPAEGRALLAVPDAGAEHGWVLAWCEVVP